jgi:hypothetical protein
MRYMRVDMEERVDDLDAEAAWHFNRHRAMLAKSKICRDRVNEAVEHIDRASESLEMLRVEPDDDRDDEMPMRAIVKEVEKAYEAVQLLNNMSYNN